MILTGPHEQGIEIINRTAVDKFVKIGTYLKDDYTIKIIAFTADEKYLFIGDEYEGLNIADTSNY